MTYSAAQMMTMITSRPAHVTMVTSPATDCASHHRERPAASGSADLPYADFPRRRARRHTAAPAVPNPTVDMVTIMRYLGRHDMASVLTLCVAAPPSARDVPKRARRTVRT